MTTPTGNGQNAASETGSHDSQQQKKVNDQFTTEDGRIDPITAVQDSIDSLSLSLFESLRVLRDAVAPESLLGTAAPVGGTGDGAGGPAGGAGAGAGGGSSGSPNAPTDPEPDFDDFVISYHNRDASALALVEKANGRIPRSREEYVKILAKAEMEKDSELVSRLAEDVLSKSDRVDELVAALPGMGRTKSEQMTRIEELLAQNRRVEEELTEAYKLAERRRDEARSVLGRVTCDALAIEEETF